ncbi:MAG: T9SS type A sorting domain-containing protein [Sphingobacteriales bacterium]|nr:MAG: T9SS type A sorting domain-containing protein [Sphingobacteriales bacterium]
MKKVIYAMLLFFGMSTQVWAQCNTGEVEVYIQLQTDNYGYEIYWQLLPETNDCGDGTIASGGNTAVGCDGAGNQDQEPGGYGNNQTYTSGPFCLTEGADYHIFYADDWGDYGAKFTILINGFPVYSELTGSGDDPGTSLPFTADEPLAYNMGAQKINLNSYINPGITVIEAILYNYSSNTITSLDLNYQIEGSVPVTETISGLNISPFTKYQAITSLPWIATLGTFNVSFWASNLNGNPDMDPSNDIITKSVIVGPPTPNYLDQFIGQTPVATIVASSANELETPRDLDFHPILTRYELWAINKGTENSGGSTVTIQNAGFLNQTSEWKQDGNAWHFMSLPTGIEFSENENFATSTGVFDANHDGGEPFTGPTLWSSDPLIYAQPSGFNGSHLDMVHESPHCMGIAAEKENVFWVTDGYSGDIVRYDFAGDHGPGHSDHSDAIVRRFPQATLEADPTHHVISDIVYDKNTDMVYYCDFGGQRIVRLDATSGTFLTNLEPHEPIVEYSSYTNAIFDIYVDMGLSEPSGIDIVGDRMVVSDHANGDIIIYDITGSAGVELGRIPTGTPGVMGVKIGPDGMIWYVNANTNEIVRLSFDLNTGLDAHEEMATYIFPNPSQGNFTVQFPKAIPYVEVKIVNLLGETVFSQKEVANASNIDLTNLPSGIYILQASNGNHSSQSKITIQR